MEEKQKSKPTLRARANKIKDFKCKNLIAVIENLDNIKNIVTNQKLLPDTWEEMRAEQKLNAISVSAIKWSFVKIFKDTNSCMDHLDKQGFVSLVTSPHLKGYKNVVLHEHDYTKYKKLAIWFGNEGIGISKTAVERSNICINIPMYGIIESLNLGTSSGIILYEITKQRREFQFNLKNKIVTNKIKKNF
ncbi:TrmH family RNA methyltransferase [Rickettsia endosymbiont of Lasioglossum villosulum]|uniref:TrmH family RNA methyltransferase n=1 Tax=Rickettsia endosymbiont of Lasioglossum villosulum TaxID=3066269 RepID=UPI0031332D47